MNKKKFNLLAAVGITAAVATLAFTSPKEMAVAETVWFEVLANGNLATAPTPAQTLENNNCISTENIIDPCALGFLAEEMDDPNTPPIEHVSDIPSSGLDVSYRTKDE